MPFTDASGDRLRNWLGVSSEEFYDTTKFAIVPMGFASPARARGATCRRAVNVRQRGARR